jgi:hypothetical protein
VIILFLIAVGVTIRQQIARAARCAVRANHLGDGAVRKALRPGLPQREETMVGKRQCMFILRTTDWQRVNVATMKNAKSDSNLCNATMIVPLVFVLLSSLSIVDAGYQCSNKATITVVESIPVQVRSNGMYCLASSLWNHT